MSRRKTEELVELATECRAYISYYTEEDGRVTYTIENKMSDLAYPEDIKISKNQYNTILEAIRAKGKVKHEEIWKGYGTYRLA